ncbi:hypothetical protein L218DRAFT_948150 [Marasmius fiardii PR-910]|nr:hypothetical protein L218DRAFT_948150 [Marasmius fiardii PR-910]
MSSLLPPQRAVVEKEIMMVAQAKGQEGLVEQDPGNLADSKPHIRDNLDPEVYEGAEGQPFYLWKDVSSTIALPGGIRASLALLAHGATAIRFTGSHSRSLPCTECYEKPQECTAKHLACSNNLPENGLSAFLEVAAQNGMTSQMMIERTLTEIDFHREQIFDLDQAIICLERLKKKTITAHDIAQDTLKASYMLVACLGWESVNFSVEAFRTPEGDPMVRNLAEGHKTVFLAPDSMTAVPKNPLSNPANLFSSEGDAQVAKLSDAIHHRPINLGGGLVVTEQSEAPSDAPSANPFANPDIFVLTSEDEAQLGLAFQHFIISNYSESGQYPLILQDSAQSPRYSPIHNPNLCGPLEDELGLFYHSFLRTRLLSQQSASIPGCVEAWIDSVVRNIAFPFLHTASNNRLHFFRFRAGTAHLVPSNPYALEVESARRGQLPFALLL